MSFSINTNIASLQAQDYIRVNSDFQSKTINRVTSGLRIVSSGDDAAGLAIANNMRSDQAVLTQGIRNANDGMSQLQIVDGGMNNISKLLDRARTLATQSASGTFTGSRSVLNSEFQSVVQEIDRQATAIGLNVGGEFAKSLAVFVGGGKGIGSAAITNGSVAVDLSKSTVDAKSLGLKGVSAAGVSSIDIGTGSASTKVSDIMSNATNLGSISGGFTDMYFKGPGFGDSSRVKVSVNLSGVTDVDTLATAVNAAISSTGNSGSQAATAFKNAGITASVGVTDTGTKYLQFTSSSTAFQVEAGDRMANALLGNVTSASDATGLTLANTVTGAANTAATSTTFGASGAGTISVRFTGANLSSNVDIQLAVASGTTIDQVLVSLTSAVAGNSALQAAGITVATATPGSALVFSNARGERFDVQASGDLNNRLGLGSFRSSTGAGGTFDYTAVTGAGAAFGGAGQTLQFSVGGGAAQGVTLLAAETDTVAHAQAALNAAFAANANLSASQLVASTSGGQLVITSGNNSLFRLNAVGATNELGFNGTATGVSFTSNAQAGNTTVNEFNSGGAQQTGILAFSAIRNAAETQTISITADDTSGTPQSLAIQLQNNSTARTGASIDEAIHQINTMLQQSNNTTMQQIVAVKDKANAAGAEGIRFVSTLAQFKVGIGATGSGAGIGSQSTVQTSGIVGAGSTADISSQTAAQKAVTALATAVSTLGSSQAVVGKGQNNISYAVNLAQSQLSNLAASESRIRDADLAAEAANLTKAQITLQAGIAALAQANSAPQAILSLLRG